jgi:uncharacterized protein YbjQ (UPF0145 family)
MSMITHASTSTTFDLPGHKTVATKGLVRGVVVRSRSVIGSFVGGLQTIFGGNITIYSELCEQAREEAFQLMLNHAYEMGGNAVVGVRYDATDIMAGVTEVLAYGTAVVVEQV